MRKKSDQNLRWILGLPLVAFGRGSSVVEGEENIARGAVLCEVVVPCRERAEI